MKTQTNNFRALLIMAAIGSYLLWSAGAAIPLIRLDLGISRTLAGVHNIAVGMGATLGARLTVPLIKKYGRVWITRIMLVLMFIGVIGLVAAPSIWLSIPSVGLAAYSQTTVNAISLAQISHDSAPSMRRMMLQTGAQAVVGATAILLISISLHAGNGWRLPIILGAIILTPLSLISIWRVKFIDPEISAQNTGAKFTRTLELKLFTYGVVNSILEMGIGFWALDLLVSRNAPVALGALGSSILSFAIATGRISLAFFELGGLRTMRFASVSIVIGVLIICSVDDPYFTMAGLAVAALGTAPLFGLGAFRVSEGFAHADFRISRYMMGTAFSYGFAPFVLAIIFDNLGYVAGYALLLPVAGAGYLLWKINGRE